MESTKRPPVYMTVINLSGLYSKKPIVLNWHKEREWYEDKKGNWMWEPSKDPIGLSTSSSGGCTQYVSYNKSDVEMWLSGAIEAMRMMKDWCGNV